MIAIKEINKTFSKKILISGLFFLYSLGITLSANAATVTWTGGGADNLVSNPYNWSSGITPQNGDTVIFNSTSKNAIWNLSVTLASLTKTSGYTGQITKQTGTTLTIAKMKRWTGLGSNELASNSANWSGNTLPQNGDKVVFDNTSQKNCTWDITINPAFLSMTGYTGIITLNNSLAINGSLTIAGGRLNLNNKNLSVDGYMLIASGGTLDASSSPIVTITVKGNWANYGSFSPGSSTVVFSGTNQYIYGSTIFYNLQKTVTTADTLYVEAGRTQTILSGLTLQGANNNLLSLRSTVNGSYWYMDPRGAHSISYADIKDLNNISSTNIITRNSVNAGHNSSNVSFPGSQCVRREDGRRIC